MKKIIIILMCMVLILPMVSAVGEEASYPPNITMDIILKCFNIDSNLCSATTTCQMEILFPNKSFFIYNGSMTNNGTHFNYTTPRTSTLGIYDRIFTCSDGSTSGYATDHFYVGKPSTDVQTQTTTRSIYILFAIAILFFVLFFKLTSFPFKWSCLLLGLLFVMITLNVVSISLYDEAASSGIRLIYDKIAAFSMYGYWFLGIIFAVIWVLTMLASLADRKNMRQARAAGEDVDLEKGELWRTGGY